MRSRMSRTLTDRKVQALAQEWLSESLTVKDRGWKCTGQVVWQIVLVAAARMVSLFAACRDLASAPSDETIRSALRKSLPKRPRTLEERLQRALCGHLPKRLAYKARRVAIDWHLIPYHGEPLRYAKELYHSQPKSGTTKFHAYATACVLEDGFRYTLATTYVWGTDSAESVLKRLLDRVAASGITIKMLLLDRQFFDSAVLSFLQVREIPWLVPVTLRGRKPKAGKATSGLRAFGRRPAGRYSFLWKVSKTKLTVPLTIVVAYKSYRHHRTKKRHKKKLLYAAWRVPGAAVDIRELYRRRFGIEASFRQLGQARIRTCTQDPVLRLFFVLVALVLRNVWVWLHYTYFAERGGPEPTLHLERLRFRRMLNWIANVVIHALHDASPYCVELDC
jgi:hypothetical protein